MVGRRTSTRRNGPAAAYTNSVQDTAHMVDHGNNHDGNNGRTTGKGSCAFSADGAKCAVIGEDGAMRVFATGSGAMIWETGVAMPADAGVGAACWTSVIGQSEKQQVVRSLADPITRGRREGD